MNLKKFTSWLLTAVMVVSLLPMAAFADEAQPCIEGCKAAVCAEGCDGETHKEECTAAVCAKNCDGTNHIVGCTAEEHAEGCVNAATPTQQEEQPAEPTGESGGKSESGDADKGIALASEGDQSWQYSDIWWNTTVESGSNSEIFNVAEGATYSYSLIEGTTYYVRFDGGMPLNVITGLNTTVTPAENSPAYGLTFEPTEAPSGDQFVHYYTFTANKKGKYTVVIKANNTPDVTFNIKVNSADDYRLFAANTWNGEIYGYSTAAGVVNDVTNARNIVAFGKQNEPTKVNSVAIKSLTDSNSQTVGGSPVVIEKIEEDNLGWAISSNGTLNTGEKYTLVLDIDGTEFELEYIYYPIDVKYVLTENDIPSEEKACTNLEWNSASERIGLDYSKEAKLKIKVTGATVSDASQGNKNAVILDRYGTNGANPDMSGNRYAQFKVDDYTVELQPGKGEGDTSINMYLKLPNGAEISYNVGLIVLGYSASQDVADTWYKDATVIPATDRTAVVTVCDAAAELTEENLKDGFYVDTASGKVCFAVEKAQNKTEGNYNIEIDDSKYVVVFVPTEISSFADSEIRTISISDIQLTTTDVNGKLNAGYNIVSYNNRDNNWTYATDFGGQQFKPVEVGSEYVYYPMYIIKAGADQNAESINYEEAQLKKLAGSANWIKVEEVSLSTDASNPINAYRISISTPNGATTVAPSLYLDATLGWFVSGERTKEFKITSYSLEDIPFKNINNVPFGVSEPVKAALPETDRNPRALVDIKRSYDEIEGTEPFAEIVITRGSGTPVYVDNALYGEVDASSLKVTAIANSAFDINYITEDSDGDNCIGFNVALKSTADRTKDIFEEIKIEFKIKGDETVYYIYGGIMAYNHPELEESTETVSDVNAFIEKYNSMTSGTIIIDDEGNEIVYEFEETFVHDRNAIKIVGASGKEVIFKRAAVSNGPVITVTGNVDEGVIENIIVDGENTRIGVYGSTGSTKIALKNVTIRNCTTAVHNAASTGSTILEGCILQNNTTAVDVVYIAPKITNGKFENNTTAVNVGSTCYFTPVVKNCSLIDNENDLVTANAHEVDFRQNYFGKTKAGTNTVEMKVKPTLVVATDGNTTGDISKVYYQPHYTTVERDTLDATLEGAEVKSSAARAAATTYVLPVDLVINPASVMKNNVFGDIKAGEAIEISATNEDGKATWVYNQETLSDMDFDATSTNIAVSDSLSNTAADTVTGNKGDATVYQEINFAHSGALPGAARITVDGALDETAAEAELHLYHIDGDKLTLEPNAEVKVTVDTQAEKNYYSFTGDHCSEYIISTKIIAEESGDDSGNGGTGSEGTTGGNTGSTSGSTSGSSGSSSASTATPAPTATPAAPAQSAVQKTPSVNDFVSALDVEEKLEASATGEAVIDITGKDLVSAKAFEVLAENPDKALVFETDGFKWTFAASDITDANAISGTTFKPAISLDSPNVDEIRDLVGEAANGFTHIYFQHHGKLPGKAKVEIFVGKAEAGVTKHVYHYLPERSGFEYMGTTVITQDGWAAFEIYGCSDYILSDVMLDTSLVLEAETEAPAPEASVGDTAPEVVPETPAENGGVGALPIIIVIAVIAVAAIFFIIRRKGEKEE